MKSKLRKVFVAPLLCLALFTAVIPVAQADIFEREVTYFCTVNVITADGVTQAMGIGTNCKPAFRVWCFPKRCEGVSTPVQ